MSGKARWSIPQLKASEVDALAAAAGIRAPAARVLLSRGFGDPEAVRRFLHPSLDEMPDPYDLAGMRAAVERLRRAIVGKEKILLYGDYDVDGTVSIVLLTKAIELAGGRADFHVPHRLKDGYGMRAEVIERAAADQVSLIISVDTGIRASEVVRRARELGIDVIVTDHHLPEQELPPALAVLNPNRPDCFYPDKNLCGAGVAFKLVQALFGTLGWPPEKIRRMTDSFLKLVAVATVADVVPLTGENRVIVKHGLAGFHTVRNPGLRALLRVSNLAGGRCPTATEVAFRVAPRMNAAGRMAYAGDVINLFLTDDEERAGRIASELHSLNQERQQAEADVVRSILEECSQQPVTDSQPALVFCGKGWHRGVVGIAASRLVERFHRPVFVLSEQPELGEAQGSGRSIPKFHLLEALESMPELFTRFGGHRQAAGLTLSSERVEEFRRRLTAYAAEKLVPDDFRPALELDAALELREIDDGPVTEILAMGPFGFGNPRPLFAVRGVQVHTTPVVWREKHLQLHLKQADRYLSLRGWNLGGRAAEFQPGDRVDVALCFEEDTFGPRYGLPGWKATLRDVRRAED